MNANIISFQNYKDKHKDPLFDEWAEYLQAAEECIEDGNEGLEELNASWENINDFLDTLTSIDDDDIV